MLNVPSEVKYTLGSYNAPELFTGIRSIYKNNGCWTWLEDVVPSGDHKFIKIVEAGVDKSDILTGENVTTTGPAQNEPGAYIFDGVDDYMTLPGNNHSSFTIAMRVRPDQIRRMDISKMAEYPSSTTFDRSFYMQSDGRITAHVVNGGSKSVTSHSSLTSGVWTHILMSGNGDNLKLYINGVLEDSINTGSTYTIFDTPEFVLGQAQETSNFFKGQISDVQFYDYVLSDEEITLLLGTSNQEKYTITSNAEIGGTINPSGISMVLEGATRTYNITPGLGFIIEDVYVDNISVGAVSSYTFTNIRSNHSILASFRQVATINIALNKPTTSQSNESGNVSSRANDNDGTNSSYWAASPYPRWWKVDLGAIYDLSSIVIRNYVDNNRYYRYNIEVSADDNTYSVIASKTNNNIATNAGDSYTVSATGRYIRVNMTYNSANVGVHIADFRAYGILHSNNNSYSISSSSGAGGTINPLGSATLQQGTNMAYSITANSGYRIEDVKVDNISVGPVSNYIFNNISANHTIAATFTPVTYTITATAGSGGSISPSGIITVEYDSSQTYTITPNNGYRIEDLKIDNISVGPLSNYIFNNITANHTIAVTFSAVLNTYTISATAGTGGFINPAGIVSVDSGSNRTYSITPNIGYRIEDVKVDNISVGPVSNYIFNNITANHTIAATFTPVTYTITATAGSGGSINPSGIITVEYDSSQTYTITPNNGYRIEDLKVDNISVGPLSNYIFNNITANHTIAVTFSAVLNTYTISATAGTGGFINPAGIVSVDSGSNRTYSITPNIGYGLKM